MFDLVCDQIYPRRLLSLYPAHRFDVAGAGACLKRYTDPSFFRTEWASSELMKAERVQRDEKARREKVNCPLPSQSEYPSTFSSFELSHAIFVNAAKNLKLISHLTLLNGISLRRRRAGGAGMWTGKKASSQNNINRHSAMN